MPRTFRKTIIQLIGVRVQGDVGPLTIYQSRRHQLVFYPKAPPLNPPSHLQRLQHARWRAAARTWRALTPAYQARWNRAAARAHLPISGYAAFLAFFTKPDPQALATLERQTGQNLAETTEAY